MSCKIIVAEDEEILRESLVDVLNSQDDMEVVAAVGSGREAIEAAREKEFDLVLLDIEMESLYAGIYAAGVIKYEFPDSKIIYLTVHDSEEMVLTAMATGVNDYIVKGRANSEILEHIRMCMRGTPIINENIQSIFLKEYTRLRESEQSLLYFLEKLSKLTPAEREFLYYQLQGYNNREISELRYVSLETTKSQAKSIRDKFNAKRTKDVVRIIRSLNLEHLFHPIDESDKKN